MKPKNLLSQLSELETTLNNFSFEECIQDAAGFDDWSEWAKRDNLLYLAAKLNGWVFICKDIVIKNAAEKWFEKRGDSK